MNVEVETRTFMAFIIAKMLLDQNIFNSAILV